MSVLGTYSAAADTPIGRREMEISIYESNGAYSGILRSENGVIEIPEVKVDGDSFTFSTDLQLPMGSIFATFNCNIVGDMLVGEVVTPYATVDLRGERA